MAVIRAAIIAVLSADHPQTVRQVFYRLTSTGLIGKTEAEYNGTVVRLLGQMRRSQEIPYSWLADATRWMRKPLTFSSMEEALQRTALTYRRALWDDASTVVEIWLEKDALAGVLVEVTQEWDVPLMVTRGYPSMSFLHSAAEAIHARNDEGQRTVIYYLGDHDPSGVDIDRAIKAGIGESLLALDGFNEVEDDWETWREDTFDEYAYFNRIAVLPAQITGMGLQTRPTKRHKNDYRAKKFVGNSVEVDAIPARQLRTLVDRAISPHVDQRQLDVLKTVEAEERKVLESIAEGLNKEGE